MMPYFYLFSDASFDPDLQIGVGATLVLDQIAWTEHSQSSQYSIQTKLIYSESISQVELTTALLVLNQLKSSCLHLHSETHPKAEVTLFTDCMAIKNLPSRRTRLESCNFQSAKTKLPLTNAQLYRDFYKIYDELSLNVLWIKGHSPIRKRTKEQQVFSEVDKTARKHLREYRESKYR